MPDEGVGRSRESPGALISFYYAHAPPWLSGRNQLNPPVDHRWGEIGTREGEDLGLPARITNDGGRATTSINNTPLKPISG